MEHVLLDFEKVLKEYCEERGSDFKDFHLSECKVSYRKRDGKSYLNVSVAVEGKYKASSYVEYRLPLDWVEEEYSIKE